MDSLADSGTGGDAPTPITGASTDREDEDAGMGLLADGRRRREPQTITRPVPALIRPAKTPTSGTLTRPWAVRGVQGFRAPTTRKAQLRAGSPALLDGRAVPPLLPGSPAVEMLCWPGRIWADPYALL